MSNGKSLELKASFEEWEWSIKVLREVIFPEIYERYGPNVPPNMQLPTETLQELRREVYGYEDVQPLKTSESGLYKDVCVSTIWQHYNDKPKHLGFVMNTV
jgi:hypothetical protein